MHDSATTTSNPRCLRPLLLGLGAVLALCGCAAASNDAAAPQVAAAPHVVAPAAASPGERRGTLARRALTLR